MSDEPLTEHELGAVERAAVAAAPPYGGLVGRLVAEVRRSRAAVLVDAEVARLRALLHHHHVVAGLPEQTPELAEAVRSLQNAMDKYRFGPEEANDSGRALLDSRCRACAEFDGTLAKRDQH